MRPTIYLGIFLISMATLTLELSLIRFFSIAQFYHFAFMVVSIAMFGIAAAGTFLSIKKVRNPLVIASVLFSFFVLVSFIIINNISFDPYKASSSFFEIFKLVFYYILLGLPFFFFGIIIAYLFSEHKEKAGRIYFYNMSGSAFGILLGLLLFPVFNIKIIIIISIIGLLSGICFKRNNYLILFALMSIILLFLPIEINISKYKELNQALNYPNSELLLTEYNSFSRVDIVNSSFTRYAPGLSSRFRGKLPDQLGVLVDAGSMNAITKPDNVSFTDYLPNSLPFKLVKEPKTLIINAGAGLDVLIALKNNASVTALETNPTVVNLLQNNYKEFSGNIYNKARVYIGEGRSFAKEEKYDVIVLSLAGNVLSSSAGLTSLSENYLLTADAFEDYYNSLTDDGVLLISRWLLFPPRESLRLFSMALETTEKENIAMYRSWTTVTLMISKNKLDEERMGKIMEFLRENRFDIIYLPRNFTPNIYGKFKEPYYYNAVNNILEDKKSFYNNYVFDIAPVYDDNPFYFNFFKLSKINELYNTIGNKWQPFFDSGFLLFFILIQAVVLALIFILLPLAYFKKLKIKKSPLMYFFCIGIAYLFIEIFFIQKLILFLGHVNYSFAVVLFSLLLVSGLGALYSEKIDVNRLKGIILVLFIILIIYYLFLSVILNKFIALNLMIKLIISFIIISVPAFFMGMPFPLGVRIINRELITWAWAVNGSASVISSVIAVIIALYLGYSSVLIIAGLLYIAGLFLGFSGHRNKPNSADKLSF